VNFFGSRSRRQRSDGSYLEAIGRSDPAWLEEKQGTVLSFPKLADASERIGDKGEPAPRLRSK
jgi:hypothetical protein